MLAGILISLSANASLYSDSIPSLTNEQEQQLLSLSSVEDSTILADSVLQAQHEADSVEFSEMPWWKQLWKSGFHIHDPRINYPKFPEFCLKVYDWGDRTFNSYDKDYVVGTGNNWKLMLHSYNWFETYMLMFSAHSRDMLHIQSNLYNDVGAYISFMAASVGYTAKMNDLFGKTKSNRHNFNFNFTCSRFSLNYDYTKTSGNSKITHFGNYKGENLPYEFNDISHEATSGELYYFGNHRKYSQSAAYNFSKYQLKGAGSAILGLSFAYERITMDFQNIPADMASHLPSLNPVYIFRYTDYGLLAGYAHNWVPKPKRWLINLTVLPSIGYRHNYSTSSAGSKNMLATNFRLRFAFVYNHRSLFASLNGRMDANLYFNSQYAFFNSIFSLSLRVGCRF